MTKCAVIPFCNIFFSSFDELLGKFIQEIKISLKSKIERYIPLRIKTGTFTK